MGAAEVSAEAVLAEAGKDVKREIPLNFKIFKFHNRKFRELNFDCKA